MRKNEFHSINEYIKTFSDDVQIILEKISQSIQKAAPKATEGISYGIPTFKLNGKPLVYFAAWKNHIGFYPTPSAAKYSNESCQCINKVKDQSSSHWTNRFHTGWSTRLLFSELERSCIEFTLVSQKRASCFSWFITVRRAALFAPIFIAASLCSIPDFMAKLNCFNNTA